MIITRTIINEFKANNSYRSVKYISMFIDISLFVIIYYLWKSITSHNDTVLDFNSVFVYMILVKVLKDIYPKGKILAFGKKVRSGNIIFDLLKPRGVLSLEFFKSIGVTIYTVLMRTSVILIALYIIFSINLIDYIIINKIPIFFLMVVSSYLLVFLLDMMVANFAYLTGTTLGVNRLKLSIVAILSGQLVPFDFYPKWSLKIIEYTPFRFIYYEPINYLMKVNSNVNVLNIMFLQVIWIIVFFFLYILLNRKLSKRITINGG